MEREETKIEQDHGHCADVLMSDYGIPVGLRVELCHEISKVWKWDLMFHDLIIAGVRGYYRTNTVAPLKRYLEAHQTHHPKNQKDSFDNVDDLEEVVKIWEF